VRDESSKRKGANEALFRKVNEQILRLTEELEDARQPETWEFVCECSRLECSERIALSPGDYEAVRVDAARFLVAPGHDDPSIEHVVEKNAGYWIVEKEGPAIAVAEETDPRS
jgi:hypothetical protein